MLKRLFWLTVLLLLAAAGVTWWLWQEFTQFRERPLLPAGQQAVLWLPPGSSYAAMVRQLESLGLTRHDWRWQLMARLDDPRIQAGEYTVDGGMTPASLLDRMRHGRVRTHRFTVVEGWALADLRRHLSRDLRFRTVAGDLSEDALMAALGCAGCAGEGRFLPETYFFVRSTTDLDLLRRAFEAMDAALSAAWQGRRGELPLNSPDELLVLASIVEKETGLARERAQVAGVFVRRLNLGMRLQTDPTVVYGLGSDFSGRLTHANLRTDHPWNTYTRHGLPPTPIALPGRAALQASAHPADGTALYFVARGDGSHQFSDTLAEHNAAVNRYIRGHR